MSTVTRIVLGIVVGILLSLMTLAAALASVKLLSGVTTISGTVIAIALLSGAFLGAVSVVLGYITTGKEHSVLVLLISLAVAALTVMFGRFGNGSLFPLGIYSLAVVNSLMISRVTAVLVHHSHRTNEPNLRG
jgi:hypothetical protein